MNSSGLVEFWFFKLEYIIDNISEVMRNTFAIFAINIDQRCQVIQHTCFKLPF